MSFFPFFMDLENADVLVVGGGIVALHKIRALLPYGPRITVVSPSFCEELTTMPDITLIQAPFFPEHLAGREVVIAAAGDRRLNGEIASLCRAAHIQVNAVDQPENCSFFFPSVIKKGPLSIGVSTGGASPVAARHIRKQIEDSLPERLEEMLIFLADKRMDVGVRVKTPENRKAAHKALFQGCLDAGRALTEAEYECILAQFTEEEAQI